MNDPEFPRPEFPGPEFSRPQRLDTIGAGEVEVRIAAEPEERLALARRFGLKEVGKLEAVFRLRRDAQQGILAKGHVSATVVQSCVATDEPMPAKVEEDFIIRFLPEPEEADADELEIDADEADTVFYTGSAIDIGEAAAETLMLSLDPFPRSANADAILKAAGVLSEEEGGKFGALSALRDKLANKE